MDDLPATGQALLHSVLDNPSEDAPRYAFADYLQEEGTTDSHRWYGRFIASQLKLQPFDEPLWVEPLLGPVHPHIDNWRIQFCTHWDDAMKPMSYHNRMADYDSALATSLFEFHRGFCRRLTITIDEFLRLAIVLFKRHPIEDVRIRDFGFSTRRSEFGGYRIDVSYTHELETSVSIPDVRLPVSFKYLLKGGRKMNDTFCDRLYSSEQLALDDLSQACVMFGSVLAFGARSAPVNST